MGILSVSSGSALAIAAGLAVYGLVAVVLYFLIASAVKRGVRAALREVGEDRELARSEQLWADVRTRMRSTEPPPA